MDREAFRAFLVAKASRLRHSAAWRFLNHEEQTLSSSSIDFFSQDNPVTNAALDDLLARYNAAL